MTRELLNQLIADSKDGFLCMSVCLYECLKYSVMQSDVNSFYGDVDSI